MQIILLHSAQVEASRAIVQELGGEPAGNDVMITHAGREVRVISKHALAVAACPNFSAYPAVVVQDGETVGVKSPVQSWQECLDFADNPPQPATSVPAPKIEFTKTDFLDLFTVEEQIALKGLEKTDDAVALFWERYRVADNIRLDDPRTIGAINMLAAAGHITPARATVILEG